MAYTLRGVRRSLRLALTIYRLEREHATYVDYIIIDDLAYSAYDPERVTGVEHLCD